ncbi:trypsin-like serine protease [Pikeienuella piscinae]|uniref:Trypsin-like serine protease n=1 Tax=Pikeienuella piscinae TaxID=2748098 RepID=A0A7M3T6H4_9RHOB|nr:trypsin-like peptidase domain-containing protein [Pikeienuella piscinae]QIE57605.1 trypsin-like serine protease [Pikeienuella piscinae]
MRRAAATILVAALAFGAPAAGQQVPQTQAEITLSFSPVVKRTAPAVVNVYTRKMVRRVNPFQGDPFFERFFEEFGPRGGRRSQNSLGSGVIVTEDGYIVTNYHVVAGADEVRVVLNDKREFDADIVFADEQADIAFLRLPGASGLPVLEFRDSDTLEVGDLVLAIGNPFGVGQTVTSGIVSALARSSGSRRSGGIGGYFIQTDAAVNPGNSGGALVDMAGRLVGVNSAILTRSGGSNGIGFAIPANLVRRALMSALDGETSLQRPWAGIIGQSVTADLAEGLGLSAPAGVVIADMHPESPLKEAGLKIGDVIVGFDGHPVSSIEGLSFRMAAVGIGGEAEVEYVRRGVRRTARMPLRRAPKTLRRN